MSVEIRQLKDHNTGKSFVPITQWEAVGNKPFIPSKTSDLNNDAGFITGFTETDPTVPAWAKESVKPSYNVTEISGLTEELAGKSNTGHTHEQYSLTGHTHEQYSLTSHTHVIADVSGLREELAGKQDVIDDLDTIRSGATLGATALQEVPSEYITETELGTALEDYYTTGETYTQTEVNNLIGAINQFRYEIYADITGVTDPQSNVLYLIGPKGTGSDQYEEYVYANSTFTKIGDTTIDLSDYATTSALTEGLAGKSNTGHTHEQYSLTSHTHSEYSLTSHTHSEYSLTSHTHTIEDVSGLTEELAGKSNTGHTHTAEEVGALPSSTTIPTATSQLTNDSNFVQSEGITTIWKGTQVQYDAIVSPSNMVLYAIVKPLELVIGSDTIEYGPNMSWNEWVGCSYNTFGWTVGSGDDYIHNGSYVLQTNGTNVLKTDIIDGAKTYSWGTPA